MSECTLGDAASVAFKQSASGETSLPTPPSEVGQIYKNLNL